METTFHWHLYKNRFPEENRIYLQTSLSLKSDFDLSLLISNSVLLIVITTERELCVVIIMCGDSATMIKNFSKYQNLVTNKVVLVVT